MRSVLPPAREMALLPVLLLYILGPPWWDCDKDPPRYPGCGLDWWEPIMIDMGYPGQLSGRKVFIIFTACTLLTISSL